MVTKVYSKVNSFYIYIYILYCKYFLIGQNKNYFLFYHIGFGVKCDLDISGPFFMSFTVCQSFHLKEFEMII